MAGLAEALEYEAKLRKKLADKGMGKGAPNPIPAAVKGTNTGMPGAVLGMRPNTYHVPRDLTAAGWTNTDTGDVFIAQSERLPIANVVAHEAAHSRNVPTKGMPVLDADLAPFRQFRRNMDALQPPAERAGPYFGLRPSSGVEEQIANLAGYEGALPAGTPITQSPHAAQLFDTSVGGADVQQMKDYYFHKSSLPYQGVWQGQVQEPSTARKAAATMKRLATRLGLNTERFNQPNE